MGKSRVALECARTYIGILLASFSPSLGEQFVFQSQIITIIIPTYLIIIILNNNNTLIIIMIKIIEQRTGRYSFIRIFVLKLFLDGKRGELFSKVFVVDIASDFSILIFYLTQVQDIPFLSLFPCGLVSGNSNWKSFAHSIVLCA